MTETHLALAWQGPLGPGQFGAMAERHEGLEPFTGAGVYLRIKQYDRGRWVSYVGQSVNVLARIDQHLTALIGLQTPVRDQSGRTVFSGDAGERFAGYDDLTRVGQLALEDAARLRFFVALCDEAFPDDTLNLAEAALKARLEDRTKGSRYNENIQGIPGAAVAEPARIENDFALLQPRDRKLAEDVLGTDPIDFGAAADEVVDGGL